MSEHQNSSPFNTQPAGLEKALADFYSKTVTFNLPDSWRKWLADNVWWLAILGGVLSLLGAFYSWKAANYTSGYLINLGVQVEAFRPGPIIYLVLAAMVLEGVLLLMAYNNLKLHKKAGWNIMFYVSLISIVISVLYVFTPGYGISTLIGGAIDAFIGWFLLFQVRRYFV